MSDNKTDALRHADMGEQTELSTTEEISLVAMEPTEWYRSDRMLGDATVDNVEVIETEHGDKRLQVTWSREATKTIGRRWGAEPNKDDSGSNWRLKERAVKVAPIAATMTIAGIIGVKITNSSMANMATTTEPLQPIKLWPTLGGIFVLVLVAWLIIYGMSGGLPGMAGMKGGRGA